MERIPGSVSSKGAGEEGDSSSNEQAILHDIDFKEVIAEAGTKESLRINSKYVTDGEVLMLLFIYFLLICFHIYYFLFFIIAMSNAKSPGIYYW